MGRWLFLLVLVLIAGCTRAPAQTQTTQTMPQITTATTEAPPLFNGTRIAGNASPLLEFSVRDYTAAVASDKLVAVYVYADWCSVCRTEFPEMMNAFDQLTTDRVAGFRVNFNDDKTDDYEREFAAQLGISYPGTKVFVRKGQLLLRSSEGWSKDRYLLEMGTRL